MVAIAVIPARGGSQRLPGKNVMLLGGRPLIAYPIEAALRSRGLSEVIVSTEDEEIAEVARGEGARVVMRPPELAQADSPIDDSFRHVLDDVTPRWGFCRRRRLHAGETFHFTRRARLIRPSGNSRRIRRRQPPPRHTGYGNARSG